MCQSPVQPFNLDPAQLISRERTVISANTISLDNLELSRDWGAFGLYTHTKRTCEIGRTDPFRKTKVWVSS